MHRQIGPSYAEQPSAMLLLETVPHSTPKQWNDGMNQAKGARWKACMFLPKWLNPDQSRHCQQPQQTNALPTKSAVATRVRSTNKNGAA